MKNGPNEGIINSGVHLKIEASVHTKIILPRPSLIRIKLSSRQSIN